MKKIISEINSILWEKTKLTPRNICICALSGGQDSVLLFIIFLHLKKQWNIKTQILHFNHFWQEKNFYCSKQVWKLAFVFTNPIYIINSNSFLDSEKTARNWRQQGLERISSIENCEKILTGHTASDRIETSFWHLVRGTSPQGLVSLKYQTNLKVQTEFFNFPNFIRINCFSCNFFSQNIKQIKIRQNTKLSFQKAQLFRNQTTEKKKIFNYKKLNNRKKIKNTIFFNTYKSEKSSELVFNKKTSPHYQIVLFSVTREFSIFKKLKKKNSCKKKKKSSSNFSFLVFKYSLFNIFILEKKQQKKYTFLIFCFIFSQKLLLRPMLIFHRNDITLFSKKYLLPIICDPSNEKLYWSRNRIRHQLFPILRFFFNPQNEYLINNYLEITNQEQKYLNFLIEKLIQIWLKKQSQVYTSDFLEIKELIRTQVQILPNTLQKRLLQKIFQSYKNLQLNFVQSQMIRFKSDKN